MKVETLELKHKSKLADFFLGLDVKSLELMNRFGIKFNIVNSFEVAEKQVNQKLRDEVGFVALEGNKIVGYSFLRLNVVYERKHLASFGIIVLREFQGKGIGGKLIDYSIIKARQLKLKKVWLVTREDNFKAKSLYESFGFVVEGFFEENIKRRNKFFGEFSMALFLNKKEKVNKNCWGNKK